MALSIQSQETRDCFGNMRERERDTHTSPFEFVDWFEDTFGHHNISFD